MTHMHILVVSSCGTHASDDTSVSLFFHTIKHPVTTLIARPKFTNDTQRRLCEA